MKKVLKYIFIHPDIEDGDYFEIERDISHEEDAKYFRREVENKLNEKYGLGVCDIDFSKAVFYQKPFKLLPPSDKWEVISI